MNQVPTRQFHRAATGTIGGAALAALILLALAVLLTREPGSAAKPVVAVWLAALPVVGLGALCGRLLVTWPAGGDSPTAGGTDHRFDAPHTNGRQTGRRAVGMWLERKLEAFESRVSASNRTAIAAGIGMAIAAVVGGIAVFLLTWSLLVQTAP